jgi:sarcosine oxidase subunit gamma
MSALELWADVAGERAGLKGPRAAQWLGAAGIELPASPNRWVATGIPGSAHDALLVARLGASEYFLEDRVESDAGFLHKLIAALATPFAGVYPVLRSDAAFVLCGDGTLDVLAQTCNVNFGALDLATRPVIMTMMIGVSVLVIPQTVDGDVQYRIWCDPTFGSYLEAAVGEVVIDCGGRHKGMAV